MHKLHELIVLIKGGGEAASAIAHRLHRSHFRICLTELASPLAVSRGTCFSEAVFEGRKTVEEVTAERILVSLEQIYKIWRENKIPIVIDPETTVKIQIIPDVLIDATMTKRETGIRINDAPLVIGIGPGFTAGSNVHIVVESNNSNNLGSLIFQGTAEKDTGIPASSDTPVKEGVVWAPDTGIFTTEKNIGDSVSEGEVIGYLGDIPLNAPIGGILRGLLRNQSKVLAKMKLIEVDPLNDESACFVIRDKMRAISGGVLEAIMMCFNTGQES